MVSLFWMMSGTAHGFCGTFVGAPGAELANKTSQVVLAREGDITTLTLVADYVGDLDEFALVIPVPPNLDPDRVTAVAPELVDRLDRYSTPRRVEYTCTDAITYTHGPFEAGPGCSMVLGGCSAANETSLGTPLPTDVVGGEADGGVTVEAAFSVAEYNVVLLSAEGSEGLYAWLDDHGFALPAGGDEILQEYIDGGASFLAAQVKLEVVEQGPRRLSPLQLSYRNPSFGLPVRMGTINAVDEQEVLIYALTDANLGELRILNYPSATVEDECMWPGADHDSFASFYTDALRSGAPEQGASWVTEYSWTLYQEVQSVKCDPCTVEREELYDQGDLDQLGFFGPNAHLTRLRMTYGPGDVPEDLSLGTVELTGNKQIRYIEYDRQLEFLFPVCGEGYVDNPGECGDDGTNRVTLGSRSAFPFAGFGAFAVMCLAFARRRT